MINHGGISNNTLTYIDKSSNTTSRLEACYGASKLSNLMVTRKSYIEKTKMLMKNNNAMKVPKTSIKGVGIKNIHKKQDYQEK